MTYALITITRDLDVCSTEFDEYIPAFRAYHEAFNVKSYIGGALFQSGAYLPMHNFRVFGTHEVKPD